MDDYDEDFSNYIRCHIQELLSEPIGSVVDVLNDAAKHETYADGEFMEPYPS